MPTAASQKQDRLSALSEETGPGKSTGAEVHVLYSKPEKVRNRVKDN